MKVAQVKYNVGVIVGRFQVPELHLAHKTLIQTVCDEHDKVFIFLGLSPLMVTRENPLDFEARKQMILEAFPHVNVFYAKDMSSDHVWSAKLDEMIRDHLTPSQNAVLYGGRDSFVDRYHGNFATRELEQDVWVSGKEIRKAIATSSVKASPDFRAGVVWAAHSQFPTSYQAVDVIIYNDDETEILLGRKSYEKFYRCIGGFVDPEKDNSLEGAAIREGAEETGLELGDVRYVISARINDWRYRSEADKVMTALFTAKRVFGSPTPQDDIAEVRWFSKEWLRNNYETVVLPGHHQLIEAIY